VRNAGGKSYELHPTIMMMSPRGFVFTNEDKDRKKGMRRELEKACDKKRVSV